MVMRKISLRLEAYERLRRARRYPGESFSEVVLRATWPGQTLTGRDLLQRCRKHGPFYEERDLWRIEELKVLDGPPR
jgi:predicted CopG family antitoxin